MKIPTFYHMLTTFTIFSHFNNRKLVFYRNVAQKGDFVLLTIVFNVMSYESGGERNEPYGSMK
jgi:hypothetical protein